MWASFLNLTITRAQTLQNLAWYLMTTRVLVGADSSRVRNWDVECIAVTGPWLVFGGFGCVGAGDEGVVRRVITLLLASFSLLLLFWSSVVRMAGSSVTLDDRWYR